MPGKLRTVRLRELGVRMSVRERLIGYRDFGKPAQ